MPDEPTLRVLSLGAGVQSTAVALLAARGELGYQLDAAIFADTGWEPAYVYAHLDRLERDVLTPAGIPLHRVSNGNLRDDTVTPGRRFVAVPFYLLAPPRDVPLMRECPTCHGEAATRARAAERRAAATGSATDLVDYELCPECGSAGEVPTGETRPATDAERAGMGRRQCTAEYKLAPIKAKVRELLGAPVDPTTGQVGRVPGRPGSRYAEQLIGISLDEIGRAKDSDVLYARNRFPLLERKLTRGDCDRINRRYGFPETAKSACIGCPFHGNRQWRDLRDNHPAEWADAVAFDRELRTSATYGHLKLDAEPYLHRSRRPLELAPIDRVTYAENKAAQIDLFDVIADLDLERELEEGPEDGCSPFACRSDGH